MCLFVADVGKVTVGAWRIKRVVGLWEVACSQSRYDCGELADELGVKIAIARDGDLLLFLIMPKRDFELAVSKRVD